MHGVDMYDNSLVVHENSWGALGHKNSCSAHAAGVRGGTTAPSTSTRVRVRRSAVEKLASPQQAPGNLHSRRLQSCMSRCLSVWPVLHVLIILLSHLGQAE